MHMWVRGMHMWVRGNETKDASQDQFPKYPKTFLIHVYLKLTTRSWNFDMQSTPYGITAWFMANQIFQMAIQNSVIGHKASCLKEKIILNSACPLYDTRDVPLVL